jgi:PucR-like helix-turn-helix protein/diguanylate cyclase with GGDEF domain
VDLAARLRERRQEIERAIRARVRTVSDPSDVDDPEYVIALDGAVAAALDYALAAIEAEAERAPPIPPELLSQARLAARLGVGLDTVLRRYFAGYALLGDFILEESGEGEAADGLDRQAVIARLSGVLDQLVSTVGEEYSRAAHDAGRSTEELLASRVRRLLAGELSSARGLGYDVDGFHVGLVIPGPDTAEAMGQISRAMDCRLLLVRSGGTSWAWLGARRPIDPGRLLELARGGLREARAKVAVGEPAEGLAGWRLTHRQARAATPIALHGREPLVRYGDVALEAALLQDDLLAASLRQLYLAPLAGERDGGKTLRETLRAYLAAERNISSAAAMLSVNRNTVANRLRTVERLIGRDLSDCAAEVDTALRLDALSEPLFPRGAITRS